ncbi:MAG: PfkB family carbohydrate kinase, partial [Chloroflexota bacterium]|nr:PfkB family carbohydrate kinase [Chloroflexota bacterium]
MARPAGHPLAGQSAVTSLRPPRIAAVGQVTWHRHLVVDCWPPPGGSEIVHAEHAEPRRTTISAVALSRLGAQVSFAGVVGDDDEGATLRAALQAEGVDTGWLAIRQGQRTGTATMIISGTPPERTMLWHPGAQIVRGDRLDIAALFDHDVVLLDVADAPLRRFLTDLPAHTLPRTRLVAPLTDLVRADLSDALEVALRHDDLIGTERQVRALVRSETLDEAVVTIQSQMRGNNLRSLVIFLGATGCRICTPDETWNISGFPAAMLNATAAGDAFVA